MENQKNKLYLLYGVTCALLSSTIISGTNLNVQKEVKAASSMNSEEESVYSNLSSGISKNILDFINFDEIKNVDFSIEWKQGWATADVNLRENPSVNSNVLGTLSFNSQIWYFQFNDEWGGITYQTTNEYGEVITRTAYVSSEYIAPSECPYWYFSMPNNSGFKSYMSYKAISSKNSPQYILQSNHAYTGNYGIRQVNGRYCVAVGTALNVSIGTYIDLILENETVIPCIVADIKSNAHTKADNLTTASNGCVSEFVVETGALPSQVTSRGNISCANDTWNSPVSTIKIYDKNVL